MTSRSDMTSPAPLSTGQIEELRTKLDDHFAEAQDAIEHIQGVLRHRQQPQDVTFHRALKAIRDGRDALRNAVPALLSEVEESRGAIGELVEALDALNAAFLGIKINAPASRMPAIHAASAKARTALSRARQRGKGERDDK